MAPYGSVALKDDSIRLLRLKPDRDRSSTIHCELFHYPLGSFDGPHLYEALSYVWGESTKDAYVLVGDNRVSVTDNLHAALLELRNPSLERNLWVDALCIDQTDLKEKERQIRQMADVYGRANRVLVWLGEAAEHSDQVIEKIRSAAEHQPLNFGDRGLQSANSSSGGMSSSGASWILEETSSADEFVAADLDTFDKSSITRGKMCAASDDGTSDEGSQDGERLAEEDDSTRREDLDQEGGSRDLAKKSAIILPSKDEPVRFLALLLRPWFRRIWVLQEVAAAREVLIVCGSAEINGHVFFAGTVPLMGPYCAPVALWNSITAVSSLMREAPYRPRRLGSSPRSSGTLGELVDMFHAHEATLQSDRVYALLGMSSDDFRETSLLPDYNMPWSTLFEALTRHILGHEISVETAPDQTSVIIQGNVRILGTVLSSRMQATADGRQVAMVKWVEPQARRDRVRHWILHRTAKELMEGDAVCQFQGASKLTTMRFHGDHWAVISVSASSPQMMQTKHGELEWSQWLQTLQSRPRRLRCVWTWARSSKRPAQSNQNDSRLTCRDTAVELWNWSLALADMKSYDQSEEQFLNAMWHYQRAARDERIRAEMTHDRPFHICKADQKTISWNHRTPPVISAADVLGLDEAFMLLVDCFKDVLNDENHKGRTALHIAVQVNDTALVERLIRAGASPGLVLPFAASRSHVAVVRQLLQAGADVNERDSRGRTALLAAIDAGQSAIVELLIEAGAFPKDPLALFHAVREGCLDIVHQLLQAGADVNVRYTSESLIRSRLLKSAGRESDEDALFARHGTPLFIAVRSGNVAMVELLLQAGAWVDAKGGVRKDRTAIEEAVDGGHADMIESLLRSGAHADLHALLGAAAYAGRLIVVETLLGVGANPNFSDALLLAIRSGHLAIVERLLQAGADVDDPRAAGVSPLILAVRCGHEDIVEHLLRAGADIEAADRTDQRSLAHAAGYGHTAIVEQLLKAGADIEAANALGERALVLAAEGGYSAVVEQLLRAGASVDAKDRLGRTAIDCARLNYQTEVIRLLVQTESEEKCEASR